VGRLDPSRSAVQPRSGITALTLAERLAASHGDNDPFVLSLRKELFL
jgi:hypothetical protein